MMRLHSGWIGGLACAMVWASGLAASGGQAPVDGVWELKFEDGFDRTELGDEWFSNDAEMRAGRLLIGAHRAAVAKLKRRYPADVRIEFDVQAFEGRPPCDLSVALASERFRAMDFNYLLAFGGDNNTVNKLTGGGKMKPVWDKSPGMLIEPGRTYHMIAVKEGKRLSLTVDGKLLLEGIDEEVMGGPGFDTVGLVSWNGMYVDNVRVYERTRPHPDTPHYVLDLKGLILTLDDQGRLKAVEKVPPQVEAAVTAYNAGDLKAAAQAFMKLDGEVQAAGLAYVYGHLNHDEKPEDFPLVADLFGKLAQAKPGDKRLADYAWAASLFGQLRIFPRSFKEAGYLLALGPKNNPFHDKGKLYRARFLRANAQENGDQELLATTQTMLRELKAQAPDNVILQQLTGGSVPWGEQFIANDGTAPRWAAMLREVYGRQLAIMEWWFTKRQLPDGQLGGGWGDDVELLRSWGPFALISDANPEVRNGIERLCEGVWKNCLVDGYSDDVGDVEHAAEPSADTIPTMMALRYGDPLWYERNLASCRRIRDFYTGVDQNGYLRFKSGHFGGDRASEHLQHGGDTFYSIRPMKHLLWAAWYGNVETRELYVNWAAGWVNATMTAKYGKPAGLPPGTIWYPSGDIRPSPEIPWNDPTYNIYGCCSVGNYRIQDAFLAGYYLSGDPYFLQPMHVWMKWHQMTVPEGTAEEPDMNTDPVGYAIRSAKGDPRSHRSLVQYRWLTGDATYDAALDGGRHPQRLHLAGDFDSFVRVMEQTVDLLRNNFDLWTREVLQTDRAGLPGSEETFAAMTGGVREWKDAGVPTMAVTWEVPTDNFAGLVVDASEDHLRVWIYSFAPETTRIGLRLWHLYPGEYVVNTGPLSGGNGFQREYQWSDPGSFTMRHQGDVCWIDVPPRQEYAMDLRLLKPLDRPAVLPDPAIAARDVTAKRDGSRTRVDVTVHNLGNVEVEDLIVVLVDMSGSEPREVKRAVVARLEACSDLRPKTAAVSFDDIALSGKWTVVLDPEDAVAELNELNNWAGM